MLRRTFGRRATHRPRAPRTPASVPAFAAGIVQAGFASLPTTMVATARRGDGCYLVLRDDARFRGEALIADAIVCQCNASHTYRYLEFPVAHVDLHTAVKRRTGVRSTELFIVHAMLPPQHQRRTRAILEYGEKR